MRSKRNDEEASFLEGSLLEGIDGLPGEAWAMPEPPGPLRDAVWRRTASHVRGRVHRRRAMLLVALIAAYGLGLGTVGLFEGTPTPPALVAREVPAPHAVETPPVAEAPPAPAQMAEADPLPRRLLLDPEALARHLAEGPRDQRARLLELAGRRFLADLGDIKRATQCYSAALDMTQSAEQVEPKAEDDWLFASLKEARQQEIHHADSNT